MAQSFASQLGSAVDSDRSGPPALPIGGKEIRTSAGQGLASSASSDGRSSAKPTAILRTSARWQDVIRLETAASRLSGVTNYGGHTYNYAYDVNGNRTSTTVDAVTTQALTFNAGNQITNPGYSFNNAGQQTHAPTNGTLTYNGAGQMTTQTGTTTSSTYTYAGPGQDELLTQNLTAGDSYKFVYGRDSDHGTPMIDSMVKNGSVNYFDNDPTGIPLAIHLSGGQADFYVLDGNGTPVALIDGTGTQTGTYTYDPYGTQTSATGTGTAFDINPYRYTTGIIDRSTGLHQTGTYTYEPYGKPPPPATHVQPQNQHPSHLLTSYFQHE